MFDLITGIIVLIVGIILYAVSRAVPDAVIAKICFYLGLALIIIGIIIIIIAILTGALGAAGDWDFDSIVYQSKMLMHQT